MKRALFVLLAIVIQASGAQASEGQPAFARKCAETGLEKLREQAESSSLALQEETFEVCGIDNRFYNPSKYVWYCATASADDGSEHELSVLVQYYFRKCY